VVNISLMDKYIFKLANLIMEAFNPYFNFFVVLDSYLLLNATSALLIFDKVQLLTLVNKCTFIISGNHLLLFCFLIRYLVR